MGMGGDFPPSSVRFFHGGLELLHGHLRLVRRGAGREDTACRNDFNDGGPGGDLRAHDGSYLLDSFYLLTDKSGVAADHAKRQACCDNTGSGNESCVDSLLQCKDEMVSRPYVAHGGEACLQGLPRRPARFEQSYRGRLFGERVDDIRFSTETEM